MRQAQIPAEPRPQPLATIETTTKSIQLAYGRSGLWIEAPDSAEVIEPRYQPGLPDEPTAIRAALRAPLAGPPLAQRVRRGASVGIVICDVTRPFPARRVIPVLLDELAAAHSGPITIFVATGTHRACSEAELADMLGPEVPGRCAVVQHDAFEPSRHARLGSVLGTSTPALVEAAFLEQDVRITTGFIEPHFFAGFSGGPKMVAPGLAAIETVLDLHSPARIGHQSATWGITLGNPVHDAVRAIAAAADVTFNLDVTLNRDHQVTAVFAGDLFQSHAAGCAFARSTAMVGVDVPFEVVLTTNSGYPLDQNLYQTVKGISAAAQIVKPGGAIVAASECSDGLPQHGGYKDLLRQADGPDAFLRRLSEPGFAVHDQWQVQVQALIQQRARVLVHAGGLSREQLRAAWFEAADEPAACAADLLASYGPRARMAVLPQG
ncbi:MAG: nickel-dependent lactate racemase, partial [Chloroflexota bacterium]|nr:nickel-dependent lactate racemase [Chloroflexota bacterium]